MPIHQHRYDEPGHSHFWTVSCYRHLTFLWHDEMKQVVIDALHMLQRRFEICLIAYVIMPDHLHAVLYPYPRGKDELVPISRLLHAFKQYVGYHGKNRLREIWCREGRLWSAPLNAWAKGDQGKRIILNARGYDFNIDRHETLLEKIDYCHKNPVTRGLVDHPADWPWSSYRYYELEDRSILDMDWDGSWPIIW